MDKEENPCVLTFSFLFHWWDCLHTAVHIMRAWVFLQQMLLPQFSDVCFSKVCLVVCTASMNITCQLSMSTHQLPKPNQKWSLRYCAWYPMQRSQITQCSAWCLGGVCGWNQFHELKIKFVPPSSLPCEYAIFQRSN